MDTSSPGRDLPRKPRLALIFGGRSAEHGVSCVSAGSVLEALDRDRYDVVAVGIGRSGRWVLAPDDPKRFTISGTELPAVDESGTSVALPGDPTVGGLLAVTDGVARLGPVDVVFPLLHGPFGEDGTVQGLLELAGLPYVGSGVLGSAVCMDKEFMKLLLVARGLPVPPYVVVTAAGWAADRVGVTDRVDRLGLPVFVKPARGGSSIGISRVSSWDRLPGALAEAHRHDPKALVEAAVAGREIECGVLAGAAGGRPEASVPVEIRVTGGREFYDFEAKYLDEATIFDVPAALPPAVTAAVQDAAVRAFEALDCAGLARVDFFLRPDGALLVNEVNTMPGFTPASMFPRMWAASGLDYAALVDRLVTAALHGGTGPR